MSFRIRVLTASVLVVAPSVAIALLVADAPLRDELIVFGASVLLAIAGAWFASAALARPVRELAESALQFARGELEGHIPVRSNDEIGAVAHALNRLSDHMKAQIATLEATQNEVRDSVRLLGETLRSTHDLRKMLSVVLETALVAARAKSGAVFLLTARRSELYVKVGRRLDPAVAQVRIPLGQGLAGWVAAHGAPARLPTTEPDGPVPSDPEPVESTALAVPLETQTQLLGVLALYGREGPEPFRDEDVDVIQSLARQAGVGVENILLHEQAQHLSITDGLTGIWNYRYFQMQLERDLAGAVRFRRSLSLLVIDIDHFKAVNDRWGHQRGDAILVELARRIVTHVRLNIDTLARYGGEEFVLILPESNLELARTAAERIRKEISAEPFGGEDEEPVNVTVSIGYAAYPEHGMTPQVLLHSADQAMYGAKSRGRDRVLGSDELADEGQP